jgi:hypothetical protein
MTYEFPWDLFSKDLTDYFNGITSSNELKRKYSNYLSIAEIEIIFGNLSHYFSDSDIRGPRKIT